MAHETMKIFSVNVGTPREVNSHAGPVTTGIFKHPVEGRINVRRLNLDGDRQADLTVHGGPYKAVYCYPHEHYAYWKKALPNRDLPIAVFGENFTTEGLLETDVHLGDEFAVGSAEVVVTQPRLPCYKLGIRFDDDLMVKRFLASGRSGFYVAVKKSGDVGSGDEIRILARDPEAVSIAAFNRLYAAKHHDPNDVAVIQRLVKIPALPQDWKDHFRERLASSF
jgi:MOSC domain-containing protein YiiM